MTDHDRLKIGILMDEAAIVSTGLVLSTHNAWIQSKRALTELSKPLILSSQPLKSESKKLDSPRKLLTKNFLNLSENSANSYMRFVGH